MQLLSFLFFYNIIKLKVCPSRFFDETSIERETMADHYD